MRIGSRGESRWPGLLLRPRPIAAAVIAAGVVLAIGLTGPAAAAPGDEGTGASTAKAKPSGSTSPAAKKTRNEQGGTPKTVRKSAPAKGKQPGTDSGNTKADTGKESSRSTKASGGAKPQSSGKDTVKGWARVMTNPAPKATKDGATTRTTTRAKANPSATPSVSASRATEPSVESTPDPDNSSSAAPTEPVITSLVEGDGTLEVHWSAPADGTPASYTVWVGGDVPDADCEEISAETHTCTINQGIVNETSYAVEVAANMAQGDPTISQPWWATPRDTDVGVPGAPVLDDIAVHGNKLTLTWAEPQDDGGLAILGYHITAMRTSDSEPVACVQPQGRTSRTCTITGTTETGYKATVAAWNSEGVGAASAEKTETALSSVPGTPTVTADLSENTATVHASSSDTGGVTVEGYEIAVTKVGSNDPVPCTGTKTSEEPILYTMGTCAFDSTQGESYSVKVRGKNSVGYSALATVTRTTAPAAPTVSVAVEGRTVTVSWTPHGTGGAAIQGYLVMVQRTGHEEHEEEVACTGTMGSGDNSSLYTGTKCTFTGIPGEEYSASVRARNSVGTSDIAGTDSDTVPPLAGPAGVTAMPGDAKATVTWKAITPATGITGYVVSYTKEGGQTQTAPVSGAATTSHELTGLENKATYSIAVKAVISEGTVAEGTAILVTPAAPPTIPDSPPEPDGDLTAPAGTTTPDPGEQITISGGGFAPNSRVDLVIYSEPHNLGTVITDQAGSFTRAVTVPHGLSGSHTIASFGVDSDGAARVLSLRVTITATTGGSGLAVTGAPIIAILLTGILLIAAGATTRFVGRYRRS